MTCVAGATALVGIIIDNVWVLTAAAAIGVIAYFLMFGV